MEYENTLEKASKVGATVDVLILVLMEYENTFIRKMVTSMLKCLNPCFNGIRKYNLVARAMSLAAMS